MNEIYEIFPYIDKDLIDEIYTQNNNDKDLTVSKLLELINPDKSVIFQIAADEDYARKLSQQMAG
jgi:hypothetical protein